MLKVSAASLVASPTTGTATSCESWPGAKVRTPLSAVKSVPLVAVPPLVAWLTVMVWVRGPDGAGVAPLAGGVAVREIWTALADGGNGGTGEGFAAERPAGVDGGGVGQEADEDAGGVAAQVPDGFADDGFGAGGKAVEGGGEVLEAEAFDGEFAGIVPVEFHGRSLRGEGGGG